MINTSVSRNLVIDSQDANTARNCNFYIILLSPSPKLRSRITGLKETKKLPYRSVNCKDPIL